MLELCATACLVMSDSKQYKQAERSIEQKKKKKKKNKKKKFFFFLKNHGFAESA